MEHASGPHSDDAVHVTVLAFEPGATYHSRDHPCARCLWRTDTDLTAASDHDMDLLARANGRPRELATFEAPVVDCSLEQPDGAQPLPWCAGWLAVIGQHHLAVHLAIAVKALRHGTLAPPDTWPRLYPNLEALLEAREEQLQRRRAGRERRA
ncbi:DUF6283 family protein [Streptomyces xylophagus]|uniref:DUF6283 family protein n=1 Tax=Streptomyces xylophagus TaxID=285514 RepID=UPI00131E3614|nr:DUF6283 family protein [Streptomyces xylophagus]